MMTKKGEGSQARPFQRNKFFLEFIFWNQPKKGINKMVK